MQITYFNGAGFSIFYSTIRENPTETCAITIVALSALYLIYKCQKKRDFSPKEGAPLEIQAHILSYLGPKDLQTAAQVNKHFQKLTSNAWEDVAKDLEYTVDARLSPLKNYKKYINGLCSMCKVSNIRNSKEIDVIVEEASKNPPAIQQARNLQDFAKEIKALDTLTVWRVLANHIGLNMDFSEEKPPEKSIEKAALFEKWIKENKVALNALLALDLSGSQLTSIPKELGELTSLELLDLSRNQLESIPKELGKLINLQILDLSLNNLKSIPKGLGKLINLQILDLSLNNLKSTPKGLGGLSNLEKLDLSRNLLKSIPKELEELPNLKIFW